jgi:hypothetical protein
MGSFRQNEEGPTVQQLCVVYPPNSSHLIRSERLGHFVGHVKLVWELRDGECSSRVKIADRGFASRQSASLAPVEYRKL